MTADPPRDPDASSPRPSEWIARRARGETLVAGCADPALAVDLARAGARVTAFDADSSAVDRTRIAAADVGVELKVEQVASSAWPFPETSFDAVVLDRTLEHQLRPARTLDEAKRVLRPAGVLVIRARYGLSAHGDHGDALYLRGLSGLLDGAFSLDAVELADGFLLAVAVLGPGTLDPAALLEIAERRLGEVDVIAYRLRREVDTERARADRLDETVRTMRASRGWQLARALREGSRAPSKLPGLISDVLRRKR